MAARRRHRDISIFEVWFEFLKDMPAWMGPTVAVSAFLILRFAAPIVFPASQNGFTANSVLNPLLPMLAWIMGGGLMAAWIAAESHKLSNRMRFDRQTGIGSVRKLPWQEFEHLVAEAYRRRGYTARVVGSLTGDGGVDVELTRPGETVLVQCKHWQDWKVGVSVARELLGVVVHRGATRGVVVTSGRYTHEAQSFADGNGQIELVDGNRLAAMINEVRGADRQTPALPSKTQVTIQANFSPACPVCGVGMVVRIAKRGTNTGSQFWGCPKYPVCRGTQQITVRPSARS